MTILKRRQQKYSGVRARQKIKTKKDTIIIIIICYLAGLCHGSRCCTAGFEIKRNIFCFLVHACQTEISRIDSCCRWVVVEVVVLLVHGVDVDGSDEDEERQPWDNILLITDRLA